MCAIQVDTSTGFELEILCQTKINVENAIGDDSILTYRNFRYHLIVQHTHTHTHTDTIFICILKIASKEQEILKKHFKKRQTLM